MYVFSPVNMGVSWKKNTTKPTKSVKNEHNEPREVPMVLKVQSLGQMAKLAFGGPGRRRGEGWWYG